MSEPEKKNKVAVTISRYWHSPQIHTVVSGEGIAIAIELDDYLMALSRELGSDSLFGAVKTASKVVLERIKEESAKVV